VLPRKHHRSTSPLTHVTTHHKEQTMRTARTIAVLAATTAALGSLALTGTASASPQTRTVHPGQSIQAAIDRSAPGDTVLVTGGRYVENLLVDKPLTLRGVGHVTLEPARTVRSNACTNDPDGVPFHGRPFNIGICIVGRLGPIPPGQDVPPVLADVPDVRLQDVEVRGFAGGVLALGTRRLTISGVEADHNSNGLFAEDGTGTRIEASRLHDNEDAALQVRRSSRFELTGITSLHNGAEGLTILDSTAGRIDHNLLAGNCAGLAVLDTAAPGPASRLLITHNEVRANNSYCPAQPERPSEGGAGIGLLGARDVTLVANDIVGQQLAFDPRTGSPAQFGGFGVLLADATHATGGGVPTGNRIVDNTILRNRPLDVSYDGSGSDNVFRTNDCTRSDPAGICR
jgi:nitrous oxidase accessory protein NosD